MKKFFAAAAAATMLFSSAANAAVTYDPATGGFVGKGDVQTAFGWNNATLQTEAGDVGFRYDTSTEYAVTCEWETVNKKQTILHSVTNTRTAGVNSTLESTGRMKNQVTGFILGAAGTGGGDPVPQVGDSCPQAHSTAVATEVEVLGSSGGGLYVVWEGQEVLLQAAP